MDRGRDEHRHASEVEDHSGTMAALPGERPRPSSCRRALEAARALGCADGLFAVAVDPSAPPVATGSWCHGLAPEDLARLVWDAAAGAPPASVLLNAPLWYAHGYREALASPRVR